MKSKPSPQELRTVSVRLPIELAKWIDSEFPKGFKQTFILQCFLSLRYVMTEGEVPPFNEYARAASIDALSTMSNVGVQDGQ